MVAANHELMGFVFCGRGCREVLHAADRVGLRVKREEAYAQGAPGGLRNAVAGEWVVTTAGGAQWRREGAEVAVAEGGGGEVDAARILLAAELAFVAEEVKTFCRGGCDHR